MKIGNFVTGSDPRWRWLSSIVSLTTLMTFISYVGLTLAGIVSMTALSQGWFLLYGTLVLASVTYVFGRETLEVVYHFKNGGFGEEEE